MFWAAPLAASLALGACAVVPYPGPYGGYYGGGYATVGPAVGYYGGGYATVRPAVVVPAPVIVPYRGGGGHGHRRQWRRW